MCTGIGIIVGVVIATFAVSLGGLWWYRRLKLRQARLERSGSSLAAIQGPPMGLSPAQGSFKVPSPGGGMSPQGSFHKSPMMMTPPGPGGGAIPAPPAAITLSPTTLIVRKGELCDFYVQFDPNREDIPGHVDKLFEKYSFENIKEAVRAKYSAVPPGW